MSKLNSFGRQFLAIITGDDNQVQAEKNFRVADSALKSRINNLNGETVELEDKLEEAKESQKLARVNNGQKITDKGAYVESLIEAELAVREAQYNLDEHNDLIEFLQSELDSISAEVGE